MRMATDLIRPLLFKPCAFDRARAFYAQFANHPDPKKRLCFEDDLLEYMRRGWVKCSPTAIAFARVINIAPEETKLVEPAWFIRFALGPLDEVLGMLPFYLPRIVWCRNNEGPGFGTLKNYSTERLFKLTRARIKKEKK